MGLNVILNHLFQYSCFQVKLDLAEIHFFPCT